MLAPTKGRLRHRVVRNARRWLLPAAAAAAVAAASLVLRLQFAAWDREQILRTVKVEVAGARNEISARIESQTAALARMARRWKSRPPGRAEWEADASRLREDYPATEAVLWIDARRRVSWLVPRSGNEVIDGADLSRDPVRREAFRQSEERGEIRVVRTFDLLQGHKGILAIVPIDGAAGGSGFIGAIFRTQSMFRHILANVARGYGVAVIDGPEELYYRRKISRTLESEWGLSGAVHFAGVSWRVRIWPGREQLVRMQSRLDDVALIGGLLVAALIGVSLYFAQTSWWRASALARANRDLAAEIEERKRAQRTAAHLAAIVDSSDDAIVGKTLGGHVVSWNKAAERLYGYGAAEMRGRSISILTPGEDSVQMTRILERVRVGEAVQLYETEHVRRDGKRVDVALTVSPIRDSEGRIVGASSIGRDITRRKRAAEELQRTLDNIQKASEDQTLSLASTSHDVRGALTTIGGYAELLSDMVADTSGREMALRIMSLAYTLCDVMGDLLQYAREQRGSEVAQKEVSARLLVQRCAEDFRGMCMEKGLTLKVSPPEEGTFTTDPVQLTRILQNLVSNAVRYTEKGEVRVEGHLSEDTLTVAVSDTGIGIPREEQEHIFEEFYRTEEARNQEKLGTGLGLSTVRRLACLLGGHVQVSSTVGRGSTFQLVVPRA